MCLAISCSGIMLLGLVGCLSNIPGDKSSGKDFRPQGAKEIKLEDGEGRSRQDVVTYPGGDRVDWKFFTTPEGPPGVASVRVRFTPPRPGLDVAFRVFDQYFRRVGEAKPTPGSSRRSKSVTIENARPGMKYYVQIYAPRRTDAGEYRVTVRFREHQVVGKPEPTVDADDIPDPPPLPALPDAPEDDGPGDPKPCPGDPTRFQPDCPKPCANDPSRFEPDCPVDTPPVTARIVKFQVISGGGVIITVDRGKNAKIEAGWQGQVLNAAGRPLDGGTFTVTKSTGSEAVGRVNLSVDQIRANRRVLLTAP